MPSDDLDAAIFRDETAVVHARAALAEGQPHELGDEQRSAERDDRDVDGDRA